MRWIVEGYEHYHVSILIVHVNHVSPNTSLCQRLFVFLYIPQLHGSVLDGCYDSLLPMECEGSKSFPWKVRACVPPPCSLFLMVKSKGIQDGGHSKIKEAWVLCFKEGHTEELPNLLQDMTWERNNTRRKMFCTVTKILGLVYNIIINYSD